MSKQQVAEPKQYRFDSLKWALVALVVVGIAVANSYFSDQSLLYRVLGGLVGAAIAIAIAVQTSTGASFWNLAKGSRAEIRRVAWPTSQERNRSTLIVVIFVFIASIILYLLDLLFGWLGSLILG